MIVQQARERVKKLVEALEETQKVAVVQLEQQLAAARRDFAEKQRLELEAFTEGLEGRWYAFLEQMRNYENNQRSQLDMQHSVFLAMQKEMAEEFQANEEQMVANLREQQLEEREMLQVKGEGLGEVVSTTTLPPTQYTYYDHLTSSYLHLPSEERAGARWPGPTTHLPDR